MSEPTLDPLVYETFPVGPLQCNCTIIGDNRSGTGVIIDPGWDSALVLERARALGLRITAMIHTHAHIDHINATGAVHESLGVGAELNEEDLFLYRDIEGQAAMLGAWGLPVRSLVPPEPGRLLVHGDVVGSGAASLEVLHTPGHTPGSLCFHLEGSQPLLFSGDTLFQESVGRTDLPGGDLRALQTSIRQHLYRLPEETVVIPGHGPATTIGHERLHNCFVRA